MIRAISSEKAVKLIDLENTLVFEIPRRSSKEEFKAELEKTLSIKIASVRTLIRNNKKYAYVRLTADQQAADVASKLGLM